MAISLPRKALFVGLASVLAVPTAAVGVAYAATGGDMAYAVEDFSYPDAAKIQAEKGIVLKRGDGNIVLTSCDGSQDLMVNTRSGQKDYCFDVKGKPAT
ncbi:hypothetical protein [Streptomyces roseus]|uniref:hypothetical protein n=1 Tax=Streptomyces roseus TaxID=66430 RepID=UPI000AC8D913|nr:hypothetical protein [Streptomyces roseus]